MTTAVDYGLAEALEALRLCGVTDAIREVVRQVRRQNADRHEPGLGDDALTLAFANWRNVSNLLERRFDGDAAVTPARPDNSFQLHAAGYTVSVYGLPAADPMMVTWRGSGVKMRLAEVNSAVAEQPPGQFATPTLDDALREAGEDLPAALRPVHLVFVHWADLDAATIRIWAGLPRNNERGGPPWLQLVELTAGGDGPGAAGRGDDRGATNGFRDRPVPDADVTWAPIADEEEPSA